MTLGSTIPLAAPTITPLDAYDILTYASGNPSVARILYDETTGYSIKGLSAGSSVITATSHNGMTAQFTMTVSPPDRRTDPCYPYNGSQYPLDGTGK